jgi:fluoride exporter
MNGFLAVALGGALGSVLRHAAGLALARYAPSIETAGTLFVNVAGSGLLGLLMGWLLSLAEPRPLVFLFFATGLCGGFTTFSTFSREAVHMFETGPVLNAAAYVGVSVAGSLGAFFIALVIARRVFA